MQEIMQYLKKYGQRLDSEIAEATGIPLTKVRRSITDMSARGEVTKCSVTRFNGDEKFEGILCRVAGLIPPTSPGPGVNAYNSRSISLAKSSGLSVGAKR